MTASWPMQGDGPALCKSVSAPARGVMALLEHRAIGHHRRKITALSRKDAFLGEQAAALVVEPKTLKDYYRDDSLIRNNPSS